MMVVDGVTEGRCRSAGGVCVAGKGAEVLEESRRDGET